MAAVTSPRMESIELSRLRPTQFTVGMLEVKHKRKRLRELEKRPGELVNFILEMPVRVVLGPANKAYVIDRHHLALALLKEDFQSAPMQVEADYSRMPIGSFWKVMKKRHFFHLFNAKGKCKPLRCLPKSLRKLKDDPYRSLAGFVRMAGGFIKTPTPFAEFQWADFFRQWVSEDRLRDKFDKTVRKCVRLAQGPEAAGLPGYLGRSRQPAGTRTNT
jgi:hypothetical protein